MELKEIIKGTSPFAEMLGVRVDGFGDGAGQCALEIREEAEIKDRDRLIAKGLGTFAVLSAVGNFGKEED
jgi:acyl-coenzyme A thioesterase PaaI-like protein